MSYRVYFDVPVAGTDKWWHARFVGEVTCNIYKIAQSIPCLEWWSCNARKKCIDAFPNIRKGIRELEQNPEKYRKLERYHEIDTMKRFFENLLEHWTEVCCEEDRDILEVMEIYVSQR